MLQRQKEAGVPFHTHEMVPLLLFIFRLKIQSRIVISIRILKQQRLCCSFSICKRGIAVQIVLGCECEVWAAGGGEQFEVARYHPSPYDRPDRMKDIAAGKAP